MSFFKWPLNTGFTVQSCPFMMLCLESIGMDPVISDCVIKGHFYKEIIGHFPIVL